MKTKVFRKISALVLAGMMTAAMSATAFAAGDDGRSVNNSNINTATGSNNAVNLVKDGNTAIPLTKSIIFFNADDSYVYEPNITFDYTVAPATFEEGSQIIKDDGDERVRVYQGVAGGVDSTASVQFGTSIGETETSKVQAFSTGTEVERTAYLTVHPDVFPHAGVYRYVITENDIDVEASGLTGRDSANYQKTRYLDVYIKNKADSSDHEMYGAIIFKEAVLSSGTEIKTTSDKNSGFGPVSTDYANDNTVDKYTTYNVTVKKVVAGSLADKTNAFPFYVKLNNTISNAKYTFVDVDNLEHPKTVSGGTIIEKGNDDKNSTFTLKHDQSVTFVGVPSNQTKALTVDVKEWNNTFDKYTASATSSDNTPLNVEDAAMDGNSNTPAVVSKLTVKQTTANLLLTVTNTIAEISPTGLVLRFAPFAIMAGFGVFFLILSRKHHKKENRDII